MLSDLNCSTAFRNSGQMLAGSAPRAKVWILLEVSPPWGANALVESGLPQAVIARLSVLSKNNKDVRVLLIHRHDRRPVKHPLLYLTFCDPHDPQVFHWELSNYSDLLDIALQEIVTDRATAHLQKYDKQLLLICTNGKRDRCCAIHGLNAYRMLSQNYPDGVWQCSHLGGHRYAPTFLHIPYGWCYGAVPETSLVNLADQCLGGEIDRRYCRGNVTYPSPVQAADYYLREYLQQSSATALRVRQSHAIGENRWRIHIDDRDTTKSFAITVFQEGSEQPVLIGCSAGKMSHVVTFRKIDLQQTSRSN